MPKHILKLLACAAASLLLSSCGTLFTSNWVTVTVDGNVPEPVNIKTYDKEYTNVTLPCDVKLKRRRLAAYNNGYTEKQTIKVSSANYFFDNIYVQGTFSAWSGLGNLLNLYIGYYLVDFPSGKWCKPWEKYFVAKPRPKAEFPEYNYTQSALGITGRPVADVLEEISKRGKHKNLGTTTGVYVSNIAPLGPSQLAGMNLPGTIITEADNKPVNTYQDLANIIVQHKPGETILLRGLSINKRRKEYTVTLQGEEAYAALYPNWQKKEPSADEDFFADFFGGGAGKAQGQPENAGKQSKRDAAQANEPQLAASDVDTDIPQGSQTDESTFALIIANENYEAETSVKYALNDGRRFREYCQKVFGLPEENIHLLENATKNHIQREVNWLSKVAKVYGNDARIIVYYAGHGLPDEKTGTAYLLPVDGVGNDAGTGYSLASLYRQMGELPARSVTVFLDACFSGSQRGEGMLTAARGIARAARPELPKGNMVVFSAAQGDETAYPYAEKSHGLFTYFLLKKLKETRGNVSCGELANYLKTQVSRRAIVVNRKSQTPDVSCSPALKSTWENLKL